jgi:hypothetical protein
MRGSARGTGARCRDPGDQGWVGLGAGRPGGLGKGEGGRRRRRRSGAAARNATGGKVREPR